MEGVVVIRCGVVLVNGSLRLGRAVRSRISFLVYL